MNRLKKIIRHTSFMLCLIITGHILVEVYILENPVTVLNVIIRYTSSIILGFLFEGYLSFLKPNKNKRETKQKNWVIWVECALLCGAGYFGIGAGTFMILFFIGSCGFFAHLRLILPLLIKGFILFLIGGFIWGNIIFFVYLLMIKHPAFFSMLLIKHRTFFSRFS